MCYNSRPTCSGYRDCAVLCITTRSSQVLFYYLLSRPPFICTTQVAIRPLESIRFNSSVTSLCGKSVSIKPLGSSPSLSIRGTIGLLESRSTCAHAHLSHMYMQVHRYISMAFYFISRIYGKPNILIPNGFCIRDRFSSCRIINTFSVAQPEEGGTKRGIGTHSHSAGTQGNHRHKTTWEDNLALQKRREREHSEIRHELNHSSQQELFK